jgi:nucleotide-binding universal stress UspA family protein
MKKVLLAVDDTKGSRTIIDRFIQLFPSVRPESIILLHVQKLEGRSLIDEMLSEAELATLKEVMEGTEYKKALDKKAKAIVGHYKKLLEDAGIKGIKTVIKAGHPAEEILNTAEEEGVDLIIVGSRGTRVSRLFMGSVSREVANNAKVPVLIAR